MSMDPALTDWLADTLGADEVHLKRVAGGASREAWYVDATVRGRRRELFLRYDRREPRLGDAFHTLQVEAEIMAALHRHGMLVPEVVAVHPTLQAVLLERVSGQTWFYLIQDPEEQVRVARDFVRRLADVHRLDPATLGITSLGPVKSAREHALDEIAAMRARVARRREPAPLLTFCIDWLERNVPGYDGPVVLVQGDTGPGNFLYENGRVTAVVDWELAHYGDPMDDIAWLSLRSAQEPFTDFAERLREYAELSGHEVDPDRVWYYRLLAETRLASTHPGSLDARVSLTTSSPEAGNSLIYGMFHRRLLVEALAHAVGLDLVPDGFPALAAGSLYTPVFDATLHSLKEAAGHASDALVARWTKSAARLVKYLQEVDRSGAGIDALELDDAEKLLGERPATVTEARSAVAARAAEGKLEELEYVAYAWRCVQRDDHLMRTASGALHHRTWPPLT